MRKKIVCVTIITVMVGVAGMVVGNRIAAARRNNKNSANWIPFTIVSETVAQDKMGQKMLKYKSTRYRSSDGRWIEFRESADGGVDTTFSDERGTFRVGRDKLMYLSEGPKNPSKVVTMEDYEKSVQFVRSDEIFGIPVAVIQPHTGFQIFVAPTLGNIPLKTIQEFDGVLEITEPVSITLAEPDRERFTVPRYPVSYDFYNQKSSHPSN